MDQRWVVKLPMAWLMACALLAMLPARATASWVWLNREQVTDAGGISWWAAPGRSSKIVLHTELEAGGGPTGSIYMPVYRDSTFAQDWSHREYVGYVNVTDSTVSGSVTLASDRYDDVHWGQEIGHLRHAAPVAIGYKRRSHDWYWPYTSPPVVVAGDSASGRGGYPCTSSAEDLIVQETDTGDTLHMTYGHEVPGGVQDTCSTWRWWVCYTRKALDAPDTAWAPETYVTDDYGTATPSVDSTGTVHFLMAKITPRPEGGSDSLLIRDYRGHPPTSGRWTDLTYVPLASYKYPPDTLKSYDGESEMADVAAAGGYLYATWIGFAPYEGTQIAEVFLARYDVANQTWSDPVRLTPNDGVPTKAQQLVVAPGGALHLMYVEGSGPPGTSRTIYHSYSQGNPLDPNEWSPRTEVSFEHTLPARSPWFAVSGDSAWVVYQCGDNGWQVWGQKGHALASSVVADDDTVTWSGAVYLDRDFQVASGGTLIIEPGTRVIAQANMDSANVGRDAGKVELVVRGTLQVNGESGDRVTLASSDSTAGHWGGILFDLAASSSGYGYTCQSYVHNADIKDATEGIAIRQTGAPSLDGVAFADIQAFRHVVLDSSDVYVPHDGGWNLTAPTTVIVRQATRSGAEIGGLNPGLVDLVVHGPLNTSSTDTSFVIFEPDTLPTSTTSCEQWGGIFYDWESPGGELAKADVGHCLTPVSLFYQGVTVRDCRLHHFHDQALWAAGAAFASGPHLVSSVIERSPAGTVDVEQDVGKNGIVIQACPYGVFETSTVTLTGMNATSGGAAISIIGGSSSCTQSTSSPETLSVRENTIVGPGGSTDSGSTWSGIHGDWMCGAGNRKVVVSDNALDGWNGEAFNLAQTTDIQMTCNAVTNSAKAIEFSRTGADTLGSRFRLNALRIPAYGQDSDQKVVRTYDAFSLKLGASGSMGSNQIIADGNDYYIFEDDENSGHTLNAQYNYWSWNGYHQTVPIAIRQHLGKDSSYVSDAVRVDVTNALADLPTGCSAAALMARRQAVAGDEASADSAATAAGEANLLPERTELTIGGAVPSRGATDIRYALAGADRRHVVIEVFDVGGRRVKRLVEQDLPGGRYGVSWNGVAESGAAVGAGVYFVRMRAAEVTQVRKIVLVR